MKRATKRVLEQVLEVVQALEHVQQRPAMYFQPFTFAATICFLNGFSTAAQALLPRSVPNLNAVRQQILKSRGYNVAITTVSQFEEQVRSRYRNEEEAAAELISVDLAAWCRIRDFILFGLTEQHA